MAVFKEDRITITDVDEHLIQAVKTIKIDENTEVVQASHENDDEVNIIRQNICRIEISFMFNICSIFIGYTVENNRNDTL